MKIRPLIFAGLLALNSTYAQVPPRPVPTRVPEAPAGVSPLPQPTAPESFNNRLRSIVDKATGGPAPELTKFSLDFPGGTVKELVAAMEKSMQRPLNVIITDESKDTRLPALKMTDVTVPQLFAAMLKLGYKVNGDRIYSSYGFDTESAPPTDESIWRFYATSPQSSLTRFDLDFPGGTPRQLVTAIEKATKKPLNVVIPPEHAEMKLPPLKLTDVTVSVLFQALVSASRKTVAYTTGGMYGPGYPASYQQMVTTYGFRAEGTQSDSTIWHFYVEAPNLPPVISTAKSARYYSLTPYLERGLSVDDITTAIQTGWKMLGEKDTPTINFHKDTKLLIAVGEPSRLETIDAVLKALQPVTKSALVESVAPTLQPSGDAPKAKKAKTETEN